MSLIRGRIVKIEGLVKRGNIKAAKDEVDEIHRIFTAKQNDLIQEMEFAKQHINSLADKINSYERLDAQQKAHFWNILVDDCAGALHNVVKIKNNIDEW